MIHKRSPLWRLYTLSFAELYRNTFGLILLVIIPPIFLLIVEYTSGNALFAILLFYPDATVEILLYQKNITLVFIGAAVSGFLTAYYALILFQRNFTYFRYCAGIGLPASHFLAARFLFFCTVVVLLAAGITTVTTLVTDILNPIGVFLGFICVGLVYGAFGGAVGLLTKDFMVAILWIVLLSNLDAGWLQNPVFYSTAQEQDVIHYLPAFYPCQIVFSAAFTEDLNSWAFVPGLGYAGFFIVVMYGSALLQLYPLRRRAKQ